MEGLFAGCSATVLQRVLACCSVLVLVTLLEAFSFYLFLSLCCSGSALLTSLEVDMFLYQLYTIIFI